MFILYSCYLHEGLFWQLYIYTVYIYNFMNPVFLFLNSHLVSNCWLWYFLICNHHQSRCLPYRSLNCFQYNCDSSGFLAVIGPFRSFSGTLSHVTWSLLAGEIKYIHENFLYYLSVLFYFIDKAFHTVYNILFYICPCILIVL